MSVPPDRSPLSLPLERASDADELRCVARRVATACGLDLSGKARLVAGTSELARLVVALGLRGRATVALSEVGNARRVEVEVELAGEPAGRDAEALRAGLAQLHDGGGELAVIEDDEGRTTLRMAVEAGPIAGGPIAGGPIAAGARDAADLADGLRDALRDELRGELRDDDRLLLDLARELEAGRSEIAMLREELAGVTEELAATNSGMVATYDALERAHDAEAQLAAIVRTSEDGIISVTPDLVITSWNEGAHRLFGYEAGEATGRAAAMLGVDEDDDQLGVAAGELRGERRALHFDMWARRRDGSSVEVAVAVTAMRGPDERLIGYSVVLSDLTERRRVEEELAAARALGEVLADRDRIARNLHDLVIQRIFGSGMSLQAALGFSPPPEVASRITQVTEDLDATIAEIRTTIYSLQRAPNQARGLRSQLLEIAAQAADGLGFEPHLRFSGQVDTGVDPQIGEQLLAVAREALSNAARHAAASRVEVTVAADDVLVVRVVDDGRGLGPATRRSGLANMEQRARALGGEFSVESGEGGRGTSLEWRVPLRRPPGATQESP